MQFAASVGGSGFAGVVGAFLVWKFIYGIGSRVIADEIHQQFYDTVIRGGGAAGLLFGLATIALLRRPSPGVLMAGHGLAMTAGFVGGCDGWRQGLWAYFGALMVFAICVAFRRLFRLLESRLHRFHTADLSDRFYG